MHRWPGGIDHGAAAASPAEPAAEAEAEPAAEAGAEPAAEAGAEPAAEAGAEPAPDVEAGDAPEQDPSQAARPARSLPPLEPPPGGSRRGQSSTVVRAWSAVPLPLRIALALLFLPPTGYVLALRSGWSTGIKLGAVTAWTALLLLAPVMLARLPGAPVHLPISSARPPALAIQDEVAAATPSSRAGVIASTASARHPGPTVSPQSTLAPGTTPTPGSTPAPTPSPAPTTAPSTAPTTAPTPAGAPPTPAMTPVATPAGTCGAPQNPWGYNLCSGTPVTSPPQSFCGVFNCVPHFWDHKDEAGPVVECSDGTYANQSAGPGSCMPPASELRPLYGP